MLELYQAYGNYHTMMDLTEGLIVACVDASGPQPAAAVRRANDRLHAALAAPTTPSCSSNMSAWPWTTRPEWRGWPQADRLRHAANKDPRRARPPPLRGEGRGHLTGPVFVHDYPAALCPLTKRKRGNPAIAERFELYVHGMELANAYTELNDPSHAGSDLPPAAGRPAGRRLDGQDGRRFRARPAHGMPPAGGLGIGIDRLVMLLTNTQTIRDVILFPLLRPEKKSEWSGEQVRERRIADCPTNLDSLNPDPRRR